MAIEAAVSVGASSTEGSDTMKDDELRKLCERLDSKLEPMASGKYIDACERVSAFFEACAFAKRDDVQALEHEKFIPRSTRTHTVGPDVKLRHMMKGRGQGRRKREAV